MQRLLFLVSALLSLTFTATAAHAQFYIGGHGGANFVQDSDFDGGSGVEGTASFDAGYAVGGVLGYRLEVAPAISIDLEGEFAYRANDIDNISVSGAADSDGESQSFLWMANAWFNWEIADSGFAPYIGGGFGGVHVDIDDAQVAGTPLNHESDFVLGGQLGAGLGYMIDDHLGVSLDYRFLITEDPNMNGVDVEYQTHSVMLGVRYFF